MLANQEINPKLLREKLNDQFIDKRNLENFDSLAQELKEFYHQIGAKEFGFFYDNWLSWESKFFKGITDIINVIKITPKDCQEQCTKHFSSYYPKLVKSIDDLVNLIRIIPSHCRLAVVEQFVQLIKSPKDCELLLMELPEDHYLAFISKIFLPQFEIAKLIVEKKMESVFLNKIIYDARFKDLDEEQSLALLILNQMPLEKRVEWIPILGPTLHTKNVLKNLLPGFTYKCSSILNLIDTIPLNSRFDIIFKLLSKDKLAVEENHLLEVTEEHRDYTWREALDSIMLEFIGYYLKQTSTLNKNTDDQMVTNILHINELLLALRKAEVLFMDNYDKCATIVAAFRSAPLDTLKVFPYFIQNDALLKNASYLKQIARFCTFLREQAPTLFDNSLNFMTICNAAKNTKNLDNILKISQLFFEKQQLTQENFEFICISPEAAEIFLNAHSSPGVHHCPVSEIGLFGEKKTKVTETVGNNKTNEFGSP
jgi:hypothetical protein